ncbi:MAG: hypothetical protein WEA58_10975 [Balneolaceae bacterium]
MKKNNNIVKVYVLSFTVFFMIDQYIVGQESLFVSLIMSATSGIIASVIFLVLKCRADKNKPEVEDSENLSEK